MLSRGLTKYYMDCFDVTGQIKIFLRIYPSNHPLGMCYADFPADYDYTPSRKLPDVVRGVIRLKHHFSP